MKKITITLLTLVFVSGANALVFNIPVNQDVHVATYAPATNLNGGDYLKVQHGYESSFVQATALASILSGYTEWDIVTAKYVFYASSLKVHSVTSVAVLTPWNHSTLVYNDVASMSFDWSTQTSVSFGTDYTAFGGWVQMDVTDAVKKWVSGANPNYGLMLYAGYSDTDVYIITQENQWGPVYGSYFVVEAIPEPATLLILSAGSVLLFKKRRV